MTVNIVEIKSGDVVMINNQTYDHLPSEVMNRVINDCGQAPSKDEITYMYGDYDVTIIRKVDN